MTSPPMISVVIPHHNSFNILKYTVEEFADLKDTEIIIIDDSSPESSLGSLNKFKNLKIIRNRINRGAAYCRNKGFTISKGGSVLFIDDDVYLRRDSFMILRQEFKKGYDICFPKIINEEGKTLYPIFDYEMRFPHLSGCFIIRRSSMIPFYERMMRLEDFDFFIRCKNLGLKAKYVEEAVAVHKRSDFKNDRRIVYEEAKAVTLGIRRGISVKEMYNPFSLMNLLKILICCFFKMRWYDYDFDRSRKLKFINLIQGNKMRGGILDILTSFIKGIRDGKNEHL